MSRWENAVRRLEDAAQRAPLPSNARWWLPLIAVGWAAMCVGWVLAAFDVRPWPIVAFAVALVPLSIVLVVSGRFLWRVREQLR